jgi:Amt family ammonium transporter
MMKTRMMGHTGRSAFFTALALGFLMPAVSWALDGKIDGETVPEAQLWVDTIWTILAGILVFLMQAGFAMVEAGFTRAKNAVNILMKNLMDFSMASLAFWIVGFGIMFGNGNAFFGTTGFFVEPGTGELYQSLSWTSVPTLTAWFFQLVFAGTAATIVSGAMAERTKFTAYLTYSFIIVLLLYPVVGHWIWGGGWLGELGMLDFAGSTVVHSVGGWFALAGAIVLGPRLGKYGRDGKVRPIPGHSLPLATLGVFILWFGWFGFNPGSTMGAAVNDISLTAANTNLAAAAGAIAATITAWVMFGKPEISMALNGALAGLVAITCSCAFVEPWAAILFFGFLPGVVVVFSVVLFDKVRVDDPVGAISVHGVCGALGTALLGLFHTEQGLLYGGGSGFLMAQLIGLGAVFAFCMTTGFLLFGTIKATMGLRVTAEEEIEGLDVGEHGAQAYPDFQGAIHGGGVGVGPGGPSQGGSESAYATAMRPEVA